MKRILLVAAVLLSAAFVAPAQDGRYDPGFHAAFKAAESGKTVKLAIGGDTVSTAPFRCGSIPGYKDGIVEVSLVTGDPVWGTYVKWSAERIEVVPVYVAPSCPNGTCPNVRYYR